VGDGDVDCDDDNGDDDDDDDDDDDLHLHCPTPTHPSPSHPMALQPLSLQIPPNIPLDSPLSRNREAEHALPKFDESPAMLKQHMPNSDENRWSTTFESKLSINAIFIRATFNQTSVL